MGLLDIIGISVFMIFLIALILLITTMKNLTVFYLSIVVLTGILFIFLFHAKFINYLQVNFLNQRRIQNQFLINDYYQEKYGEDCPSNSLRRVLRSKH